MEKLTLHVTRYAFPCLGDFSDFPSSSIHFEFIDFISFAQIKTITEG